MKNNKKNYKRILLCLMCVLSMILCMFPTTIYAAYRQTKTTRDLDVTKTCKLTAYAAFDTFGHNISNGKEWNYKASASISKSPKSGTLALTVTGMATVKTSGSMSLGVSDSGVSAGGSSSWKKVSEQYTQKKSIKKSSKKQTTTTKSNLIVTPRKYYKTNTACILAEARVRFTNSRKVYRIKALA